MFACSNSTIRAKCETGSELTITMKTPEAAYFEQVVVWWEGSYSKHNLAKQDLIFHCKYLPKRLAEDGTRISGL